MTPRTVTRSLGDTNPTATLLYGAEVLEGLQHLKDASVHTVCTSPPYFQLRDYGVEGQLGLEATPEEYVARLVSIFQEVKRVLHPSGTVWLNLGDSYARDAGKGQHKPGDSGKHAYVYDHGGGRASGTNFRPGTSRADGIVPEEGGRLPEIGMACPSRVASSP